MKDCPSVHHTGPARAFTPPLYAGDPAHRTAETDTPSSVDEASICAEWDDTRDYCACVRWTVDGRPYSAWMGARAWATSADAPIFVDEWQAGPLTDGGDHATEVYFCVPSERWWSSARVVGTTMEQLAASQRVPGGNDATM
jgi:hypothetical protein